MKSGLKKFRRAAEAEAKQQLKAATATSLRKECPNAKIGPSAI